MENKSSQIKISLHILSGLLAGTIATVPMSAFMLAMHRILPRWQKYALPPEEITRDLANRMPIVHNMKKREIQVATVFAHFGYGAAMGGVYGVVDKLFRLAPVLKGSLFGLLVWAGSYLGWLPAMDFSAGADEQPIQRNTLMIGAHIIWGAITGIVVKQFLSRF